jgi:predicted RNase H-like HicB family nuclease
LKINLNRLKLVIMEVKAIIHEAEEGGYWAEVPAFPGCVTQAETVSELESNLNEAVQAWLLAGEVDIKTLPNDQTLLVAV